MKKPRNAWRRLRGSSLPDWAEDAGVVGAQGLSLMCTWADINGALPLVAHVVSFALLVHGLRRRE